MNDDTMKQNILMILLIVAGIGITWFVRGCVDEKSFENRILKAGSKRDTIRTIDTVYLPEQKKSFRSPPNITPQHRNDADSVFAAGIKKGADSAAALFTYHTAPEETTITFDSVGTLWHRFTPLTRLSEYTFQPFPRRTEMLAIIDSIFVPMPSEQPWYDHWYVGSIGTILIVLGASQL